MFWLSANVKMIWFGVAGIGPKEHLEELGIKVVRNLRVGYNLQDHVGLGGLTFIIDDPITFKKSRFQTASVALEYILNERGPLTSLGGVEGLAFVNSRYADPDGLWPDVQFHFAPSSVNSDGGEVRQKIPSGVIHQLGPNPYLWFSVLS